MERQADDPAVVAVRPPVVRAAEVRRVAHLCPADLHSSMQTHVEHRSHLAVLAARDDERVVQHPAHHVVARPRDLRLVRDEQPRPAEQALALQPEDLLVVVDVRRDHPPAHIPEHVLVHHRHANTHSLLSRILILYAESKTECRGLVKRRLVGIEQVIGQHLLVGAAQQRLEKGAVVLRAARASGPALSRPRAPPPAATARCARTAERWRARARDSGARDGPQPTGPRTKPRNAARQRVSRPSGSSRTEGRPSRAR